MSLENTNKVPHWFGNNTIISIGTRFVGWNQKQNHEAYARPIVKTRGVLEIPLSLTKTIIFQYFSLPPVLRKAKLKAPINKENPNFSKELQNT